VQHTWARKVLAVAELCRISNLPTAWADVLCGWLVSQTLVAQPNAPGGSELGLALLASTGLYLSGMVWNDVFDVEIDQRERPGRPIPSGRVSWKEAVAVAAGLMGLGWLAGLMLWWMSGRITPAILATGLVGGILIYDGGGKRFVWGVGLLAACRFANVLLGGSILFEEAVAPLMMVAMVNGIFVLGVSVVARRETGHGGPVQTPLRVGAAVVGLSFLGLEAVWLAAWLGMGNLPSWAQRADPAWGCVAAALAGTWGLTLAATFGRALRQPEPRWIQTAVGRGLQGIIFLDAFLAWAWAGPVALLITLLWPVARWLSRQFAPT
jgi:4-hydroxybenzoate polyprenyltransferase